MSLESKWIIFRLGAEPFGFEIQYVREMLQMPAVRSMPLAEPDCLGVTLLRSEVIPVFDLRRRFGWDGSDEGTEQLVELLQERQRDHEAWLEELEASVRERREFTLTTDPHKCKFGQWYDHYSTDNPSLGRALKKFDAPHRQIHASADEVRQCLHDGQHEKALQIVENTRALVLARLVEIFAEAIDEVRQCARRSLVVIGTAGGTLGVSVDAIEAVISCSDEEIQAPDAIPGIEAFPGLIGLLAQKQSAQFIQLLDPAQIYPQLIPTAQTVTVA